MNLSQWGVLQNPGSAKDGAIITTISHCHGNETGSIGLFPSPYTGNKNGRV
eukprot:COSAG06_NODE_25513_length_635_cov_0.686567_1_plen_50_part_10